MDVTARLAVVCGVACPSSFPVGALCTLVVRQGIWPVYGDCHRVAFDDGELQEAYPGLRGGIGEERVPL